MKRVAWIVLLAGIAAFLTRQAFAASPAITAPISSRDESHQYSMLVKDNGSANAFLMVYNLGFDRKGGLYRVILPDGATGPVKAWYVDEGVLQKCVQPLMEGSASDAMYPRYPCYESVRTWVPIEHVVEEGDSVTVTVPPTKGHVSLGVTWKLSDVTEKTWWGRKVTITTPVVDHFVAYSNVSVDFPDGVYVRDKAVGPVAWGDMESGVMMSQPGTGMTQNLAFTPEMFDRIGGSGDVFKSTNNLAPGDTYSFTLLTATARWKLFVPEIATMLGVSIALALVVSLLLRLLIGRKPFAWYLSVVVLILLLAGMTVWLFRMYSALLPRPDYPVMMRAMDVGVPSVERIEEPTSP
ncbi:MAG TPA: hypothetical protein VJB96_05600 [Patescibacteria group bacterium]|nr:hypothetical protein [Patescibacteria group bacterium]